MAAFDDNFDELINQQIIPRDTKKSDLNNDVKKAIENLNPEQIVVLGQIARDSKAHIFVHETDEDPNDKTKRIKKSKIIAMGL
jgi:hypothetical protein